MHKKNSNTTTTTVRFIVRKMFDNHFFDDE